LIHGYTLIANDAGGLCRRKERLDYSAPSRRKPPPPRSILLSDVAESSVALAIRSADL